LLPSSDLATESRPSVDKEVLVKEQTHKARVEPGGKAYEPPKLTDLGPLSQITLSGTRGVGDGIAMRGRRS
jgi:hypothetical protein